MFGSPGPVPPIGFLTTGALDNPPGMVGGPAVGNDGCAGCPICVSCVGLEEYVVGGCTELPSLVLGTGQPNIRGFTEAHTLISSLGLHWNGASESAFLQPFDHFVAREIFYLPHDAFRFLHFLFIRHRLVVRV